MLDGYCELKLDKHCQLIGWVETDQLALAYLEPLHTTEMDFKPFYYFCKSSVWMFAGVLNTSLCRVFNIFIVPITVVKIYSLNDFLMLLNIADTNF